MNIIDKIDRFLLNETSFKVGDEVIIKTKISGLKKNHKGIITKIDGEYHLVLPAGRKKGQEVELYSNEIKNNL